MELSDEAERDEADSVMWDEIRRDRDAEEASQWRQRRDNRALRIEDWAEWQNREDVRLTAEAREAKAMEEKDWAQWTNRQVQQSEAQLRQRDAARYRDWEQWVLLNTPPSGSTRTRREYRVEAAVFVDGKQAVKKARWSIAMAPMAKVGYPQEVSAVQGLVEGGRPADTSGAMGSGSTTQGQGWPSDLGTSGGVSAEVSGAPVQGAASSPPVHTPGTMPVPPGGVSETVLPTVVDLSLSTVQGLVSAFEVGSAQCAFPDAAVEGKRADKKKSRYYLYSWSPREGIRA